MEDENITCCLVPNVVYPSIQTRCCLDVVKLVMGLHTMDNTNHSYSTRTSSAVSLLYVKLFEAPFALSWYERKWIHRKEISYFMDIFVIAFLSLSSLARTDVCMFFACNIFIVQLTLPFLRLVWVQPTNHLPYLAVVLRKAELVAVWPTAFYNVRSSTLVL